MIKAISLFSCAGIGELMLDKLNLSVIAANELIEKRAEVYRKLHQNTEMIVGDISDLEVKKRILSFRGDKPEFLIATPPCQGLSTVGKNKLDEHYSKDERNFLIFDIITIIKSFDFKYILIENVPKYLEMYFPKDGDFIQLIDLLEIELGSKYTIEGNVYNAKDYGVPQSRPRAIIKIYKKDIKWPEPRKEKEIPLKKSIGQLPSLKPGEFSELKWHYAKPQREDLTKALEHTPTGKSALNNLVHFPKNKKGEKVRGFHNTYKRMIWEEPAHARTTYNGSISSHNNVHPGHLMPNGLYSDPRVLSIYETLIVSTIDLDTPFPANISDSFLRTLIGEGVPPKFMYELIKPLLCQ
jgi:DNA (cytosine-5)-methyltransferase 1